MIFVPSFYAMDVCMFMYEVFLLLFCIILLNNLKYKSS